MIPQSVDEALSNRKIQLYAEYVSKYYPQQQSSVLEKFTARYREDKKFGDLDLMGLELFKSKYPEDKTTMLMVLTNGFGDEFALTRTITRARASRGPANSKETPDTAMHYETWLFERWSNAKLEPDTIRSKLLLTKGKFDDVYDTKLTRPL
ncbi:hypothetical protein F441_01951 [Phytophthora nicotianae CJ01A1]|uniref:RxLR effector protein n=1 Tax=Phytophthora nicotianae CJ01A1 TaxID=1317063 RepID=W2XQJ7_PHYNI|nr:hypothetical protein F441_01951 [Phytophthora nicotianae CJ01A1]